MNKPLLRRNSAGVAELRLPSGETTPLRRVGPAFEFVLLDRSGSMSGKKFTDAQAGVIDHASYAMQKGYEVGLIAFGDTSERVSPLVRDEQALRKATKGLDTQIGTYAAPAFGMAIDALAALPGTRVIALFTDGQLADEAATLAAGMRARKLGIHIITIGTHDANTAFLEKLQTTGSLVIPAAGALQAGIADAARLLPPPK